MTRGDILLDTCAAIWIAQDAPMADAAVAALDEAFDEGTPIYVSPMTAWEIGVLAARDRWVSTMPPARWFDRLMQASGYRLAELSPAILIASSFLPGKIHRDPVDRILAGTAREHGLRLMTRDRALLDYSAQGHMGAIAC